MKEKVKGFAKKVQHPSGQPRDWTKTALIATACTRWTNKSTLRKYVNSKPNLEQKIKMYKMRNTRDRSMNVRKNLWRPKCKQLQSPLSGERKNKSHGYILLIPYPEYPSSAPINRFIYLSQIHAPKCSGKLLLGQHRWDQLCVNSPGFRMDTDVQQHFVIQIPDW